MFGIGGGEMVIIFLVLLFAVGPDKMPTFARAISKGIRQFRATTQDLRKQVGIDAILGEEDIRDPLGMKRMKAELTKPLSDIRDVGRGLQSDVAQVGASMTKPGVASANAGVAAADAVRIMTEQELAAEQPALGVDVAHASTRAVTVEPQA
jgi:Sec-independent protein translocase protein TatA